MIRVIRYPLPLSSPHIPSSLDYKRLPRRHPHSYLSLPPPLFLSFDPPYVVQSFAHLPSHLFLLLPLHCPHLPLGEVHRAWGASEIQEIRVGWGPLEGRPSTRRPSKL